MLDLTFVNTKSPQDVKLALVAIQQEFNKLKKSIESDKHTVSGVAGIFTNEDGLQLSIENGHIKTISSS